jgi:hypothetical protein
MSSSADPRVFVCCSDCGKQLKAPISWMGRMLKCPGCETYFRAEKRTPDEQAALQPKKKKKTWSSSGSSKFVEDRKGLAELQALGLGIGLSLAGAALSLAGWYFVAMKLQGEARWFSLILGAAVGIGMYAGYRKADVAMGMLAALLALGAAIGGKFIMYHSFADAVAGSLGASDFTGARAVLYGELFAEKSEGKAINLVFGSRREQDKAHRDLQKVRKAVVAEVEGLTDQQVTDRIREMHQPVFTAELDDLLTEDELAARRLSQSQATDQQLDEVRAAVEKRLKAMSPPQLEAEYFRRWTPGAREEVAMLMSKVDEAIAIRDKQFDEDDTGAKTRLLGQTLVKNREAVAGLAGFDLYLTKLETQEKLSQVAVSEVKGGASTAAGMSLLSPRTAMWLFGVASLAFGFATGGRFNS